MSRKISNDTNNFYNSNSQFQNSIDSISSPIYHDKRQSYFNKSAASHLPNLPHTNSYKDDDDGEEELEENVNKLEHKHNNSGNFIEFDLSNKYTNTVTEKIYSNSNIPTPKDEEEEPIPEPIPEPNKEPVEEAKNNKEEKEEDFFNTRNLSNWKPVKEISEMQYNEDKNEFNYSSESEEEVIDEEHDYMGYTKLDTEEQSNKYFALDKKTDFLFNPKRKIKETNKASQDVIFDSEAIYNNDSDSDDENYTETKNMLTDSQKFAYLGISKLLTVDMATDLAKIQFGTSSKVAKFFNNGQKNFSNWTMYVMLKLYEHLNVQGEEKNMIENLSKHGVETKDLSSSLMEIGINAKLENNEYIEDESFDLRWVVLCDLFIVLISDGYYDSRSRSLLMNFAKILKIPHIEILQFERRLIETLDMEIKEKSMENKDDMLNDQSFVKQQIKKNRNKRLAYIGLAAIGGSLAIGLTAGLLAPVIGAGIAAGLTTIGITGTSSFLAGVGGGALITTTGVAIGAQVGSKAGSRRAGEVHTFEFKPLHNNKRCNLILTVSGWKMGKFDDVRLPFSTVDPVMGDIFSLLWEPEMLESMGQTIGILASEALSTSIQQILGATILTALMSAIQIPMALSKLSYLLDNPWNVSLDRAWKAGKLLAKTILSGNLGVRPITLVGFSLGARLIYSCLIEMSKRGGYGLIENVIILGSPVSIKNDQLAEARSMVSGRFINGYSRKDWILGYLFRATGGGVSTVAGLSPLEKVYGIENVDCTDLVEGHMSYLKAIPKILKRLDWEVLREELGEVEELDPEQGERHRQLLEEFDEARAKLEVEEQYYKPKGWKKWFKPKKKEWWDIYSNTNEKDDKGDEIKEYDVEESEPPAIFDVDALVQEVKDIEESTKHASNETTNVMK
ncbi:unnamed protein product [Candida verbasci]|uniref:DUF726-domain-containing protein n=1 Tax=Candida verbasci TaxID=1227364 RepID=A0A9W4X8H0_9ASCO|nr:unnamed protein product [Candida verbasci]